MKINIFKTTTIIDRENASKYIHRDEAKLPSSIIDIQERAFFGCFDLKNVNLSECNRLSVIGNNAFGVCTSLKELKFPKGITKIEGNAFKSCINLEKIASDNSGMKFGRNIMFRPTGLSAIISTISPSSRWKTS